VSTFIYALSHPKTKAVAYVGKTTQPKYRLANHITSRRNCALMQWRDSILAVGGRPVMTVVEEVAMGDDWRERERYWIAKYKLMGAELLNIYGPGFDENAFVRPYHPPPQPSLLGLLEKQLELSKTCSGDPISIRESLDLYRTDEAESESGPFGYCDSSGHGNLRIGSSQSCL
jgi:hypothetical protein